MKMRGFLSGVLLAAPLALLTPTLAAETQAPADAQTAQNEAKVAAVQAHVDAYRSGDLDRFVATFTPDAEVHANGMVARGHDEIRAFYRLNFGPQAPEIKIIDSGFAGEFVLLTAGYTFSNGSELCCSYSEYEVRDGKISYLASSSDF